MSKAITSKEKNYSDWYNDLVVEADMAEHSDVRGCMVIKPHGYAIWEKMQATLDKMFKDTGHVNAYFPLFIPKSYLSKEAAHVEGFAKECAVDVEGFAKECAVVTHYRLKNAEDGSGVVVDPEAKLEEEHALLPKPLFGIHTKGGFNRTATCPCLLTNGQMWFAGKCVHVCFCAPLSFSGKKATQRMLLEKKQSKKLKKC